MAKFGTSSVAVALAACLAIGGAPSSAGTRAAAPPTVTKIHARALSTTGSRSSWVVTATAVDRDRDLVGGRVRIQIGKKMLSRRIAPAKARRTTATPTFGITAATLTGRTLRIVFFVNAAPRRLAVKLSVVDAHGHGTKQVTLSLKAASKPTKPTAPTVTIAATQPAAAEPATAGAFTVTRTGSTAAALTVSYTVGGTATAGTDYGALSGSVMIPARASSATITVSPVDDRTTEPTESVIATLVAKAGYVVGAAKTATVTIADNDAVPATTVTITATDSFAAEPSSPGAFTVTRTGSTASSLVVSYSTSGTATPGIDYTTLPGTVTIPAGSASATITVAPIADSVTESSETVIATLLSSTGYAVGTPGSATVAITDAPAVSVSISATDASAAEPSDTGTFTVTRTGSTSSSLTVTYSVSGTATSGTDYTALSGSVTIPAGASTATITVTPVDDTASEANETVTVTLSTGTGYTLGLVTEATVQIADDDSGQPTVSVTATDPTAAEPNDSGTFRVTRTGSKAAALAVTYSVTGTATSGTDYAALSGVVTIPAAQASATITVAPIDNSTFEVTETVIVTLSPDPDYTVGTPSTATVTIADNDTATVTIAATDPSAAEPSSPGTFTVTRTGPTTADLVVTYLPSGSAVNGADYVALSGSVTIPAGASSATITVTPIDDSLVEGAETVTLTLTDGTGYVPGTPSSDTVTIADND